MQIGITILCVYRMIETNVCNYNDSVSPLPTHENRMRLPNSSMCFKGHSIRYRFSQK